MENIEHIENDNPEKIDWLKVGEDLDSACICISAKRRSGKSHLCREMCYYLGQNLKPDLVVLFSETADFNDDFDYISEYFKYNHYDEEIMMKFIHQQEENMKIYKQKKKKNKNYNKEPPHLLFILDDVAHDKNVFYSKAIGQLAVLGRHIRCSCIMLTQYLCAFSPKFRQNCDLIITFRDPDYNLKKYIIDSFMTLDVNSRSAVKPYIDKCFKEPYMAMVIMVYKIQEARTLSDYIGYYKAKKNPPKFKLGQKQFWNKQIAIRNNKKKDLTDGLDAKQLKFYSK